VHVSFSGPLPFNTPSGSAFLTELHRAMYPEMKTCFVQTLAKLASKEVSLANTENNSESGGGRISVREKINSPSQAEWVSIFTPIQKTTPDPGEEESV
jgi:hypothetical protein